MAIKEPRLTERRLHRSGRLADALRLQLEACREGRQLAAIVVSDELGFCVAHSGGGGNHEELAAQLPILAHAAQRWSHDDDDDGPPSTGPTLVVRTFSIDGDTLHACAVAEPDADTETGADVLSRVASGFTRLLAQ